MGMKSVLVDERDTNWENDDPVFRVVFVEPANGATEAFDVREARIDQVLDWAHEQASGRRFSIAVVLVEREDKGLVWIYGTG